MTLPAVPARPSLRVLREGERLAPFYVARSETSPPLPSERAATSWAPHPRFYLGHLGWGAALLKRLQRLSCKPLPQQPLPQQGPTTPPHAAEPGNAALSRPGCIMRWKLLFPSHQRLTNPAVSDGT